MPDAHPINKPMNAMEWALLAALSILWGGVFFLTAVAVRELPPLTVVVLRVGLAALALNAIVLVLGQRMPKDLRVWGAFFGMGLLNNALPFSLIVWGQTHIASGLASILNAATPLCTVVVAHALTDDEKLSGGRLAGVVIGFGGVVLMIGPGVLEGLGVHVLAQLAVLGATVSYAFAGVFGRRFRRLGVAPVLTATGQVTASTVMLLPVALVVERPWTLAMPGAEVWGAVLGLALAGTALAYIVYFRILATAGATNLLLVTFLLPISTIVLGTTILGERLEAEHFVGMAVIGLGLAAIDGRPLGALRRLVAPPRRRSRAPTS
jgi:drug/metabolite transporter (DMT)-like permease